MTTKNKLKKIRDVWEEISKEPEKKVSKDVKKRIKVTTIFAGNSTGKTRLSKQIWDTHKENVLIFYNAYTEDLFSWNNDEIVLNFDHENKFLKSIKDKRKVINKINENFNEFTGLSISIDINFEEGWITFSKNSAIIDDDGKNIFEPNIQNNQIKLDSKISNNDEVNINIPVSSDDIARDIFVSTNSETETKTETKTETETETETETDDIKNSESENINNSDNKNIKISKGEESIFVWSIFYTILEKEIDDLINKPVDLTRSDKPRYVVIDDPVSSMDDKRIITIALELGELIKKSNGKLEFIITTHHALFYNVLLNYGKKQRRKWNRKNYVLTKSDDEYFLKKQGDDDPFAYHHQIIEEITNAISKGKIKRNHFNQFRALLEKTANFLRCSKGWTELLTKLEVNRTFIQTLHHFSHDSLSELESKELTPYEMEEFGLVFKAFIEEFEWFRENSPDSQGFFLLPYKFIIPGCEIQSNIFDFSKKKEDISREIKRCCDQAIVSNIPKPKFVSIEDNIVWIKVSLFNATVQNTNSSRGIVADFLVPYMKYSAQKKLKQKEPLNFLKLGWDTNKIEKNVKTAIVNYERGLFFEYRIKEVNKNQGTKAFEPSNLFAGYFQYNEKNIWIKNEEEE